MTLFPLPPDFSQQNIYIFKDICIYFFKKDFILSYVTEIYNKHNYWCIDFSWKNE